MKIKTLLFTLVLSSLSSFSYGQNYLRVANPDGWWGPNSSVPGWEEYVPHGIFEEVSLVVSPKGIYTEIEMYATIRNEPDYWTDVYEIIWQFDLPAKTIVHDSWLWVEDEIIRADVVDYWTALTTYEEIVGRNQDPSFLYILPDNRYEIRIFPLFVEESRKIKLSFLVPAVWDRQHVTQELLQNIFQSTDYPVGQVSIAMPVDDAWGTPVLKVGVEEFVMTETVIGGTGEELHYLTISGNDLTSAEGISMQWNAPFTGNNGTYVSTYANDNQQFYQLAYLPDWDLVAQDPSPDKALILLDHKPSKTLTSLEAINNLLREQLDLHLSSVDAINVAIATTSGIQFLHPTDWVPYTETTASELEQLLAMQDTSNLHLLLQEGLTWAQAQGDATQIFVIAANDDYTYPPVAEEVFVGLEPLLDPDLAFSLLDYQNENVSVIYYADEVYYGNSHLYQLLADAFTDSDLVTLRDQAAPLGELLGVFFPSLAPPSGVVDYHVSLQNGVCYERFNLSSSQLTPENGGVLLQTGKYLGELPMEIEGFLVTDDNNFLTLHTEISPQEVQVGDTLMQEMWYAQHLKSLFGQVASNADREHIIDLSIRERILTPLTAFLALEPGLGGEPCIGCLDNNGNVIIFSTEEFDISTTSVTISPNPAIDYARIRVEHPSGVRSENWQAVIFDTNGKAIVQLPAPQQEELSTTWEWKLDERVPPGVYWCKISSEFGEVVTKIVVVK